MERLIELYIDTNTLEFYNREGSLGAYTPAISAGELARLTFQLCDGPPRLTVTGRSRIPTSGSPGRSPRANRLSTTTSTGTIR